MHSVGLKKDGTIVTWGNNEVDQLNDLPIGKMLI
jgi:alpha-tubulin suppressor-like RCC1 family protein